VTAWITTKRQPVLDRCNARRSTAVPPGLIGHIAPTRTEGINLPGVFTFPIEPTLQNADKRRFRSERNGHCIPQAPDVPGTDTKHNEAALGHAKLTQAS